MSVPHEAIKEVERFLLKGEKIGAVKYLKDKFGFSLDESKQLVDTLETQLDAPPENTNFTGMPVLDPESKSRVMDLLIDEDKIEAIRYVKESLHVSLKTAREVVEGVAHELFPQRGISRQRGVSSVSGKIVFSIFFFAGIISLGIGVYLFARQSRSIEKSELIRGKVVRLDVDGEGMSAPVIEYDWNGQKWLYSSTTRTNPPAYEIDEEVDIFVNREDSSDITVDTFSERWLGITLLGILGVLFTGIPLAIAWFTGRR